MTRGSIPRFDLYEELEVSRTASVEVIEAAYKALVKRHHPDVSAPADDERIKRLNVARDWLVPPSKRRRYDDANGVEGERRAVVRKRDRSKIAGQPDSSPARQSSPSSFGPNSRDVRHFLAQVRELDGARARQVLVAREAIDAAAYAAAREAAQVASQADRGAEWALAREAATVIAHAKLAGSQLSTTVATTLADVAGAIVVRDLIDLRHVEVLIAPWTRSDEPVIYGAAPRTRSVPRPRPPRIDSARYATAAAAAVAAVSRAAVRGGERSATAAGATVAAVRQAAVQHGPRYATAGSAAVAAVHRAAVRGGRYRAAVVASGAVLAGVVAIALLAGMPERPEANVAALTSRPTSGAIAVAPTPDPASTDLATDPGAGPVVDPSANPPAETPGTAFQPATPRPRTPQPPSATPQLTPSAAPSTGPTPTATPSPTAGPTPTPSPTPSPTPTPQATCDVISLIGVNTSNAQATWSAAGFTGSVLFSPQVPPQYKIGWQSLTVGQSVPCSRDISVQRTAPAP